MLIATALQPVPAKPRANPAAHPLARAVDCSAKARLLIRHTAVYGSIATRSSQFWSQMWVMLWVVHLKTFPKLACGMHRRGFMRPSHFVEGGTGNELALTTHPAEHRRFRKLWTTIGRKQTSNSQKRLQVWSAPGAVLARRIPETGTLSIGEACALAARGLFND